MNAIASSGMCRDYSARTIRDLIIVIVSILFHSQSYAEWNRFTRWYQGASGEIKGLYVFDTESIDTDHDHFSITLPIWSVSDQRGLGKDPVAGTLSRYKFWCHEGKYSILRVESYNGNGSKINSNEPNGGRREVVRGTIAEFFYDAACEPFFPDSDDDKGKHFVSFPLNGRPINEAIQEYFKKNLIRGYISN